MAADMVRESIRYARISERIAAVVPVLQVVAQGVARIAEIDPDLEPELLTVMDHLTEALSALSRAHDFIDARLDVTVMNPPEEP